MSAAQAMCMYLTSIWAVDSLVAPLQDDILMFGGGGGRESRPQYVQNEWSLATEFIKDYAGSVQLLSAASSANVWAQYSLYCCSSITGLLHRISMQT